MNRLHAQSVNTVRVITYHNQIIGTVLRMGIGKSVLDNGSSGGIYAEVDRESGIVVSQASDYDGNEYWVHPDTGVTILGFEIPFWNECKKMIKQACPLTDGCPLVGWDVAITPNGVTLIEVNERPDLFLLQHPRNIGVRDRLNDAK